LQPCDQPGRSGATVPCKKPHLDCTTGVQQQDLAGLSMGTGCYFSGAVGAHSGSITPAWVPQHVAVCSHVCSSSHPELPAATAGWAATVAQVCAGAPAGARVGLGPCDGHHHTTVGPAVGQQQHWSMTGSHQPVPVHGGRDGNHQLHVCNGSMCLVAGLVAAA
jgi:hypothetical protein